MATSGEIELVMSACASGYDLGNKLVMSVCVSEHNLGTKSYIYIHELSDTDGAILLLITFI